MRETWESLIRDFMRHLKGTNRAVNTQRIYRAPPSAWSGSWNRTANCPLPVS